jgi:hypothetical protein
LDQFEEDGKVMFGNMDMVFRFQSREECFFGVGKSEEM